MPAVMAGLCQFSVFGKPQAEFLGTVDAPTFKARTSHLTWLLQAAAEPAQHLHA
jgi:hypothetical protein